MNLLFDIETIPQPDEELKGLFPEEGKRRTPGLDARQSRILVISYCNDQEIFIKDGDEDELVRDFWVKTGSAICSGGKLIGYNVRSFDVPYMWRRTALLGLMYVVPKTVFVGGRLHDCFVDVVDLWRCGNDPKDRISASGGLSMLSQVMGGPSKSEVSGKYYWQWRKDDPDRARKYIEAEMECLALVAERMGVWP